MIISLTGFMGCGKSSVGRKLSELLACDYIDLDDIIETYQGKTIAEIFRSDGEAAFRRMESEALEQILSDSATLMQEMSQRDMTGVPSLILALGGGTVSIPDCARMVHEKTLCIYLRATIDTLVENLTSESAKRPMLSGHSSLRGRIADLMSARSDIYEKTAHIVIDTDGKTTEHIAAGIIAAIRGI